MVGAVATVLAAIAFRGLFEAGLAAWGDDLHSSGVIWVYVGAPLAALLSISLWSSRAALPRGAGRVLVWGTGVLAVAAIGYSSVLWYSVRMLPCPTAIPGISASAPASWEVTADESRARLGFTREYRFGEAAATLAPANTPSGTRVEELIALVESTFASRTQGFRIVSRETLRMESTLIEKRGYGWRQVDSKGGIEDVRGLACYLDVGGRLLVLWASSTPGYGRESERDVMRIARSIRKR